MTQLDAKILLGRQVLLIWFKVVTSTRADAAVENEIPDIVRSRIDRIVSRRKEWLGIFFTSDMCKISERLQGSFDGRLLCFCVFQSVSEHLSHQVDNGWVI